MMKWLSLILSFVLGRYNNVRPPSLKESLNIVFEEITIHSRRPVTLILSSFACVIFLCGGFFMGLLDITNQIDREGYVHATAGFIGGLSLVVISGGILAWIFTSKWPGAEKPKAKHPPKPEVAASGLEQALTLLVMDFIKERELKREERLHPHPPVPSEPGHRPPTPPEYESTPLH